MPLRNKEQLLGDASQIRKEILEGHNTAERVGKMFVDIIEALEENFLSRLDPDTAQGLIKFMKGAEFGDFVSDIITGKGGKIDQYGNGELESLIIRRFLEVPELRYNRIDIEIGNSWRAPGGGIVLECVPDKDKDGNNLMTGTITLHLEEGEIGCIDVDDICMGIFHNEQNISANSTIDYDDGKGNFRFAGFYSCYFRITEIIKEVDNSVFRYALRPVSSNWFHSYHPVEGMHFVAYGNFSIKERQSARYSTRTYERYLKDVNNWEFDDTNIAAQFGDLSNLKIFGLEMSGYSAYLNNIYMTGRIEQVLVYPYRLEIDTDGDNFIAYGESKHISCNVYHGWDDVTHLVTDWKIERDTGDPVEDAAWRLKQKVKDFKGEIDLCLTSEENDIGENPHVLSTLYTITALLGTEKSLEAHLII